ncbi:bifunctional ADP-dependent NAD(P)H-hydrate dehydratase/NAD(P)H-hydrate epimerase [Melaminivora sp.]
MQRLTFAHPQPLYSVAATRHIEALASASLPPSCLMQQAGQATARLARALAPHARKAWIACGSGNNGGDGLEAAIALQAAGLQVHVTCLTESPQTLPEDARHAWQRAAQAGILLRPAIPEAIPELGAQDICVDALLGLGLSANARRQPPDARLLHCLAALRDGPACLLQVDLPSGLLADSGQFAPGLEPARSVPRQSGLHTLSLLTLKPGLFTALGRDAAGQVWFDDLGLHALELPQPPACAWLGAAPGLPERRQTSHARHKGSFGDVAIVGGEGLGRRGMGMTGAALLAASAALHAGAGRVLVSLLEGNADASAWLARQPECMPRHLQALDLASGCVVAGCGGGLAIAAVLGRILEQSQRLVLDADALNAIAGDRLLARQLTQRCQVPPVATVLTPHPLEAARLLGSSTEAVQADRLSAARELAERFGCTVLLKGSGSVIAAPGQTPRINPSGNALLATAGTGDVLAGLLGARLAARPAQPQAAFEAALQASWQHGALADHWPHGQALTAWMLARALQPD